ncbi:MAG: hypothetical protein ACK56F_30060, partial [bacterium]
LHTGVQRFLRNPAPCTTFWKSRGNRHYQVKERHRRERRLPNRPRQYTRRNRRLKQKSRNSLARDDTQRKHSTTLTRPEQRI